MDREQFDRLSRLVAAAGTRRDALRLLVSGVVIGAAAGIDGAPASARNKSHKRSHGKAHAQLQQPPPLTCPTTCNQNCSNKPIHGGVNLTKCDLNERDLDGVQLNGANLTQACFGGSSLRNANFRGANLSKTCLCGADLAGADFRGSNVTQQQLDCAQVACNTIKPNGKPAIVCSDNETCCDGICVNTRNDSQNCGACGNVCEGTENCCDEVCVDTRNDVDNCGTCGNTCAVCQGCAGGTCENLPDFLFDCNGKPLQSNPNQVCTTGPSSGICDGGLCNCGPGGRNDPEDESVCLCNQTNTDFCANPPFRNCCQISQTCLNGGTIFNTEIQCVDCKRRTRA